MKNSLKTKIVNTLAATNKKSLMRVAFKLNREDKNSQCDHTEFENGTTHGQSTL